MPTQPLLERFNAAQQRHAEAIADLALLLVAVTFAELDEVLPGAAALETHGEMNEDGLFGLRITRVLDNHGQTLYDIHEGTDAETEDRVDQIGADYLDLLLELTGDDPTSHAILTLEVLNVDRAFRRLLRRWRGAPRRCNARDLRRDSE